MEDIKFTKMVASGNDFVVIPASSLKPQAVSLINLAQKICDRRYGVGADGLLVLEKSKIADIKMRIFNTDGSEAQMCGNGSSCVALWTKSKIKNQKSKINIETKAGIIESEVNGDKVKIKLTDPKELRLNIPLKVNQRSLQVNFINTGVPHTVIFVEGLDKIDVVKLGRQIRYHRKFAPAGTNVDFVEIKSLGSIKVRTYERGVEDETLACGTGAVASAIISNIKYQISNRNENCKVNVQTRSGDILKVYFKYKDDKFSDVWLEGKARIVYQGVYYV